jgi:DNA-binding transcriptional regulator YdaS (Cro superfamily)
MDLRKYCHLKHGQAAELARCIGVPSVLISQWANGVRATPIERCLSIERASNGIVTRRDLRPGDWHLIWPELADAPAPTPSPAEEAP